MQRVLPFSRMSEMEPDMDAKVLHYLHEGQIETFESFETFNLLTLDWYDVASGDADCPQLLIYQDREDLFFFCEDTWAEAAAQRIVDEESKAGELENQQLLCHFFSHLLKDDMKNLDRIEGEITDTETEVLTGTDRQYLTEIAAFRKELMQLKRYYEQLGAIFEELCANENGLLGEGAVGRFVILNSRVERYLRNVISLREAVAQMREAYQAQLSIQQNDLMRVFTIVTVIFLPLTLLVGWYGMNFSQMPELGWEYGYPTLILFSVGIVGWLIWLFKKKKWL